MTGDLPTVSVVIPCYRYGRQLPECVNSALDQPGVDVRVLIIDDASPDDSYSVAEALAAADERVTARRHEVNQGHIATYNEGLLGWADGEFSILISADDVLAPGALARATDVLRANPAVGFVYGHAVNWHEQDPRPPGRQSVTGVTIWPGAQWVRTVSRLGHSVITSPEVVVRTSVQQRIGGYLPSLPHTADLEMWLRFAAHSDVAFIKGVDQAYYRIHQTNMTKDRVYLVDLKQRQAAFDEFFEASGQEVPDAAELHEAAQRQVAKEALWRACRAYERRRLDETPVDELVALAGSAYPKYQSLPEYWGLRWRRVAGPRVTPYLQVFMLSAVHRKVSNALWWRRWERKGI
jgi:Glycosyl transferase family 2